MWYPSVGILTFRDVWNVTYCLLIDPGLQVLDARSRFQLLEIAQA
jgi:hypothetical protein